MFPKDNLQESLFSKVGLENRVSKGWFRKGVFKRVILKARFPVSRTRLAGKQ